MRKKIHRGGNAEQYHADKKYKEAVADAVVACATYREGPTCYIARKPSMEDAGSLVRTVCVTRDVGLRHCVGVLRGARAALAPARAPRAAEQ